VAETWGSNGRVRRVPGLTAAVAAASGVALIVALGGCSSATPSGEPLAAAPAAASTSAGSPTTAGSPLASASATSAPTTAPTTSSKASSTAPTAAPAPTTRATTVPKAAPTPAAPPKTGAACLIGTWAVDSMKQSFWFNNNTSLIPSTYESGSFHYTYGKDGTISVRATNLRVGGKGPDGHFYERVFTASGSTSYTVQSNGSITYGSSYFGPGTQTSYVDHVAQPPTTDNEFIGTTDNYYCQGNSFHTSGRDYQGNIYSYFFSRLS
jgi:hypothetical protein